MKHPQAVDETAEAAEYLNGKQAGLGERFVDEVEMAVREIQDNPRTGFPYDFGTRIRLVKRFHYGVVFLERADTLWILSVTHLHRKPGYWADRLDDIT